MHAGLANDDAEVRGDTKMKRFCATLLSSLLLVPVAGADEIGGRLFFTPEQRALLDRARQQNVRIDVSADNSTEVFTLNGIVRRSDGRSTAWVNGKPLVEDPQDHGFKVLAREKSGAYTLKLPYAEQALRLKVGQSEDATTGEIRESYRRAQKPATRTDRPVPAERDPSRNVRPVAPKAEEQAPDQP
jgi:hypothetical protein